ncbi:MAG: DoxX family protein [Pseudomonadota bacterium]
MDEHELDLICNPAASSYVSSTLEISEITERLDMSVKAGPQTLVQSLPKISFGAGHWFLRLPLAAISFSYGYEKFFDLSAAEAYGLPVPLYALAGVGEVLAAFGLIIGGIIGNRFSPLINFGGDVITRLSGFALAAVTMGVIAMLYWGPFAGMQFHILLLAGALYFLLRGNELKKGEAKFDRV